MRSPENCRWLPTPNESAVTAQTDKWVCCMLTQSNANRCSVCAHSLQSLLFKMLSDTICGTERTQAEVLLGQHSQVSSDMFCFVLGFCSHIWHAHNLLLVLHWGIPWSGLGGPNGIIGIEPRLVTVKANTFLTALLPQSQMETILRFKFDYRVHIQNV